VHGSQVPQLELDLRKPLTEHSDHVGERTIRGGRDVADDQFPEFSPLRTLRGADRPSGGRDGLARLGEKCSSRRGQLDPSVRPAKQARSDLVLEAADLLAQRRLRDVQARSGAAEMQLLGHGEKGPEVSKLHAGMISLGE
jgi:hypothetical protein